MKTKIFADANLRVGEIDRNLFGSFIEHLGRAVYEGIYEPGHPTADENGFREDVIGLIRELNVPIVRYPGGNFLSGYDWRDGIGPREKRPTRLDLAWLTTETNEFGTDEFMKWWDGPWQTGHLSADEYGKKALEAAKVMRWTNGEYEKNAPHDLKLIVSGSSNHEMKTFPEWDRTVLEHTYKQIDLLSMHRYYMYSDKRKRPLEDFLGSADDMNEYIGTLKATIEYVRAKERSQKRVGISFDEWNIWTVNAPRHEPLWKQAPHLLEDVYTFQDALVFAGLMNTLLNNCDVVKTACLAQLVNVIAPIMTEKGGRTFRQTSFYPFRAIANHASGRTVRAISDSDTFENMFGNARCINEAVTHDAAKREVCVSLCNYAQDARAVELELRSFGTLKATEYTEMTSSDLFAVNSFDAPETVVPHGKELPKVKDGSRVALTLPAMSWSFLRFEY